MQSRQRGPKLDNAFHANEGQTWITLSLTRVYCLTCMSHYHNPTKETLILTLILSYCHNSIQNHSNVQLNLLRVFVQILSLHSLDFIFYSKYQFKLFALFYHDGIWFLLWTKLYIYHKYYGSLMPWCLVSFTKYLAMLVVAQWKDLSKTILDYWYTWYIFHMKMHCA